MLWDENNIHFECTEEEKSRVYKYLNCLILKSVPDYTT